MEDWLASYTYDIFHNIATEQGRDITDIRDLADNLLLDRRANAYFGDTDPVRFGAAGVEVDRDDAYFDRTGYDKDWD